MAIWISALSLVVSICAGGWQVYSWRRTGVSLLVWAEESGTDEEPELRVIVTNEGRQPVALQWVGIRLIHRPYRFRRSVGVHRSKLGYKTVLMSSTRESSKLPPGKLEPYDTWTVRVSYAPDTHTMMGKDSRLRLVPYVEAAGKYWLGRIVY